MALYKTSRAGWWKEHKSFNTQTLEFCLSWVEMIMTFPPLCLTVLHYSTTHPPCHRGQRGSRRTELTWRSQFLGELQCSPWWSSSAIPGTALLRLCTDSSCLLKEMSKATGAGGFPQGKATFLPWADTKFLLAAAKTLQRGCSQKRSKVIWAVTKHSLSFNQEGCTATLME